MTDPNLTEEFVRLQTRHQQRVYSFILTLVPHWSDAQDVLQETGIVMWRKFGEFEPGSDFVRWANQIAYYEALKFRQRQAGDRLRFRDQTLERVADSTLDMAEQLVEQRDALRTCLEKLPPRDRDLIERCYQEGVTTKEVAEQIDRPAGAVYKSVQRIRRTLLECARREMAEEDGP